MRTVFQIIAFVVSISTFGCQERTAGITAQKTTIIESVYSSAIVEPDSFYKVFAAVRGITDEVFVEEGDLVQRGDLLVRIVNDNSELQSRNAALEVDLATMNYQGKANLIQELKDQLQLATMVLVNDSINFLRQQRLWEQNIGSKNELEQRQLTYQASCNKVDQIKSQVVRKEEELRIILERSKNNHANRLIQQADFEVRSRIKGKVYELLKEEGELVSEQEPIALVGSNDNFILKMQVDEVDIVRVKEEQLIYVTLDAYKGEVFTARVWQIIPKMNQETQTFWVEGTFENQPDVLYSGLRGEANIVIDKKVGALTIPLDYLIDNRWVITADDTVEVVTGLHSLERVEIMDGLDSTLQIFPPK